jgi:DNA-binding MarR family transcriptional regulator
MPAQKIAELARELGREMTEMRNLLKKHIQLQIKTHHINITFEILEVLALLYQKDGINQQEIAGIMVKDKSSMTYLIHELEKRKLVKRVADETDGRNKLICLTKQALQLKAKLNPWIIAIYEKATASIKINEIKDAIKVVQKMNNNLNK